MSTFGLFLDSLRMYGAQRGAWHKRAHDRLRYAVRSLLAWPGHARWLALLDDPRMRPVAAADPRLLARHCYAYLSRRYPTRERLAVLESHYRCLLERLAPSLFAAIYVGRHCRIGSLVLKDGSELGIELEAPRILSREGELSLYLVDAQRRRLSMLTLSVADQGRSLLIGCIQGAARGMGKDPVRELTRQSHGLRPKNLLLSMAYAFAAALGVERIRAIGAAAHPFAGRADKIKSDYDSFWLENGGRLRADGFYDLPAAEPVRDPAQVESKHRSAFRRREALRRDACELLVCAMRLGAAEPTAFPPLAKAS